MPAINGRNKLYKEFIEEQIIDSKIDKYNTYKAKRNLVTTRLRKAKNDYYNTFLKKVKIMLRRHGKVSGT